MDGGGWGWGGWGGLGGVGGGGGGVGGEVKLNESGRQKQGRWKSCQQAQQAKLYSDSDQAYSTQAQKEGTFDSPRLPPGAP